MPHTSSDRPHSRWFRIASRQGDDMSLPYAHEGQVIVRQAAGETAGLIIAAQIQKAARALGYPADSWRIREAWYGRCACWSAQAMRDLQEAHQRRLAREHLRRDAERARQAAADRALLESTLAGHLAEVAKIQARLSALGEMTPDWAPHPRLG